ncbi:MAG: hypothetical protein GX552_00820 [Chloroflexi bacterium]|nr:hypothetical protein [Chloroflexota bacterium]
MTALKRLSYITLAIVVLFSAARLAARADVNDPRVIEAEVLVTADMPQAREPANLMVQATSWVGAEHRYVLTLGNFSPWPIPALRVFHRYFSAQSEQDELTYEWLPDRLEPGQVASLAIELPPDPLPDACHQLEIHIADGLDTFLVDCSPAGATTVWNVPLTDEMRDYLSEPALTMPEPENGSKLGIHVTANSSPQIMDFVRDAQPAIVVAVGDLGWLADVKEESPETITVARFPQEDQTIKGDPVERAREFVEDHAARYLANPGVDYWMGWNEPTIDNVEQMRWYAAFESERTRAMAELGLKVAVGNFPAGTPEAHEFKTFLPALAVAKKHGGVLALHEYSAPTLLDGVGADIPGLDGTDNHGALTLRYRFWYDHYLRPNNLVLPLVITEAGIDGGVLPPQETGLMGWRDFYKPEPGAKAVEEIPEYATQEYLDQLSWYDDQLRCDPYVLGFGIFNVGGEDSQWKSFDITSILPNLAELVCAKSLAIP